VTLHYADAVCDYPLEFKLYERMEVKEAVRLLDEHGVKHKPEALERKKSDSDRRRYLGPKLRRSNPEQGRSAEGLAIEDTFPNSLQRPVIN
jgi:hypothetical protein